MTDAVTRVIQVLRAAPQETWEVALRREFGGRHLYFASTTGLHQVRQLMDFGVAGRTARWKVRAR